MNASANRSMHDYLKLLREVEPSRTAVGWTALLLAVVGVPCNLWLYYIGTRLARKKRANVNLWLILSMNTADLLFCASNPPILFIQYALKVSLTPALCLTMYVLTYISAVASSLNLLALNIDKFLSLNRPLHYHLIVTRRRTIVAAALCWQVAIVFSLAFFLGPAAERKAEECNYKPKLLSLYVSFLTIFFILPAVISILISTYIAWLVLRNTKANKLGLGRHSANCGGGPANDTLLTICTPTSIDDELQTQQSATSTSLTVASATQPQHKKHRHCLNHNKNRKQLRSILFIFSASLWAAATTLPYRVLFVIYALMKFPFGGLFLRVLYGLLVLLTMNAVGNPFITLFTHRQYKKMALKMIKNWINCSKQDQLVSNHIKSNRSSFGVAPNDQIQYQLSAYLKPSNSQ